MTDDTTLYFGGLDPATFAGSMADEIEQAFNRLLPEPLPTADSRETRDRRRLFVAIAEGVIKHLDSHSPALNVVFDAVPFEGTITAHVTVTRQQP
jgi:hypothetical protein